VVVVVVVAVVVVVVAVLLPLLLPPLLPPEAARDWPGSGKPSPSAKATYASWAAVGDKPTCARHASLRHAGGGGLLGLEYAQVN
jgi:hypothetical protein